MYICTFTHPRWDRCYEKIGISELSALIKVTLTCVGKIGHMVVHQLQKTTNTLQLFVTYVCSVTKNPAP
jgi:hypothetical protein